MGFVERDKRTEASIPLQSRIDIRTIMELVEYWESVGVSVNSISRTIAWSLDLLREVLRKNDVLPVQTDSVSEAFNYLVSRDLYKGKMKQRGMAKICTAIGFENLRAEGVDPAHYAGSRYRQLHNQVKQTSPIERVNEKVDPKRIKMAEQAIEKAKKEAETNSKPRKLNEQELVEKENELKEKDKKYEKDLSEQLCTVPKAMIVDLKDS